MQKLCCVRTRQHPLPVWSHKFVISSPTHFSINFRPFLVGIVSQLVLCPNQPNDLEMVPRQQWACCFTSMVSCRKDCSWSSMESLSVLMPSCEDEEDDHDDDEDEDDVDDIDILLERSEYSTQRKKLKKMKNLTSCPPMWTLLVLIC